MIPLDHQANAFYSSSSSPYRYPFCQQTVPKVYTIRNFNDWVILTYTMCTYKATQYDHASERHSLVLRPFEGEEKGPDTHCMRMRQRFRKLS